MSNTERDRQAALAHSLLRAQDAAVEATVADFRLVGVQKPFHQGGPEYNHLVKADAHLSLCDVIAVARTGKLRPARLELVDCLGCLDEFAKVVRPAGSWLR